MMQKLKQAFESAADLPAQVLRSGIVFAGLSRARSWRATRNDNLRNWIMGNEVPVARTEGRRTAAAAGGC